MIQIKHYYICYLNNVTNFHANFVRLNILYTVVNTFFLFLTVFQNV